jgi:cellulose synthase/poly-beta-1,6-N-acetylglucosamine synthase-like glycosyltransferase
MIKYSIIVPAYNAAFTLPRCLAALGKQSIDCASYEIIVVDDGSLDQTAIVAERILGPNNAQVIRAAHGGPAQARNLGAQAAHGELLLFTDADCEPAQDWIERLAAAFDDPIVGGAKGVYRTRQRSWAARFVQQEYQDKYDRMRSQSSIDFVDTYSATYRREVFVNYGGFDPAFIADEDQELSFRLTARGVRLVFAPDAIVYHQHVTSLLKYLRRKFSIGYWKALVLKRHPDKAVRDTHTPQTIKVQMGLLALSIIVTITAIFAPIVASVAVGLWLLLLLSMLPLLIKIARRDPPIMLIAPIMIVLRAFGLGTGLAVGLIRFSLLK